jgi:hypothetical protein
MHTKITKQKKLKAACCKNPTFAKKVGISKDKGCNCSESKISLTTFLTFDRIIEALSDAAFDELITELNSGRELNESKSAISASIAAAVYHRDYLKRKKERKAKKK